MNKKKILFVTDVMAIGGVEKVLVNTLNGLKGTMFDITLFILYKVDGDKVNISKLPKNIKIIYLFNGDVAWYMKRVIYYLLMFFPSIFKRLICKDEYDVVITTKDVFTYPISLLKCKKIMWVHGGLDHFRSEKKSLWNTIKAINKKRAYYKFDRILLLTNNAKANFCSKFNIKERCYVQYNPINSSELEKIANENVKDYEFNGEVTFVCSSRLSQEKGIKRLLAASLCLINEGYNFNLLLIGDGPDRRNLEEFVNQNNILRNIVVFLGFKENPYKYMKKANIYISPSLTEGFSMSIAEAILLGLPVISTNCSGSVELLNNGEYGFLTENSEKGIRDGMRHFLSNPSEIEYFALKSAKRSSYFTYNKTIKQFEEHLLTVGEGK